MSIVGQSDRQARYAHRANTEDREGIVDGAGTLPADGLIGDSRRERPTAGEEEVPLCSFRLVSSAERRERAHLSLTDDAVRLPRLTSGDLTFQALDGGFTFPTVRAARRFTASLPVREK